MTDPYNTYLNYAPKPRQAPLAPGPDPVARRDVSDAWKQRFRLFEKAGGAKMNKVRDLSKAERRGMNFNAWAFLFGPFYFLAKGLWRQALVYLLAGIAIMFAMVQSGHGDDTDALGIGFAVFYSMRANISYYQMRVLGKAPWV